jgi:branched-chain amino acid aminotransferase
LKLWLNGALVEEGDARISPADHGFLVADGVFETLRCYAGVPFALADHAGRLAAGAAVLGIDAPSAAELQRIVGMVVEANGLADARVRITLTSGPGPPGLVRAGPPTLLVSAQPLRPWPPAATAMVSRHRRDEQSPLAGVKTIAVIENLMAQREARAGGADEAILLNTRGDVCEASTANVFAVRDGAVTTPPRESGCLPGITRERVLLVCREAGVGCTEAAMPLRMLFESEELFLTSSTREIQPLVAVDGNPVGDGAPGPVSARLAEALSSAIRRETAG